MKLGNRGFTVVELIASFVFSSALTMSLFAIVLNFRDKEINTSIETELYAFKQRFTITVEQDIQRYGLKSINYCKDGVERSPGCIILSFNNAPNKVLRVNEEIKQDIIENYDGSTTPMNYKIQYISYDGIRYDLPDSSNLVLRSDYLLESTTIEDGLESNTPLYRIRIVLAHQDLDVVVNISIVANGTESYKNDEAPYKTYEVGDQVTVLLNKDTEAPFVVIRRSDGYSGNVTLLYNGDYTDESELGANYIFNEENKTGNVYEFSDIKAKLASLAMKWTSPNVVRLITAEEVASIVSSPPKVKAKDVANWNLTNAPAWLVSSNYWTMTPANKSNKNDATRYVWAIEGGSRRAVSSLITNSYRMRPVIEVNKTYVANQ